MSQTPAISVIMSVHNGEQYLAEAVESILAQTLGDFEFIIIDDGSTDNTPTLLREYQAADGRICIVTHANRGLTKALNEAIHLARAPLLARMDADDISLPNRFERQVAFLRAHPMVVCVGADHELIDGGGRLLTVLRQPSDNATVQTLALQGRIAICHPVVMMRRQAVIEAGGYDEQFAVAQDLDLWLRLGEVGELANIPEVLLKYRQHAESVSEKRRVLQMENMRKACELAWERRGLRDARFLPTEPWRSGQDRASRLKFALRYGWWAFNSAQRRTALLYGLRAVMTMPLSADGWRLLACAALKPMGDKA
jgi:glycosyltransferase involved in cell wall biosynthesis